MVMKNFLVQSELVTLSEKLLKSCMNKPFHIGGKFGFLNLEIVANVSL